MKSFIKFLSYFGVPIISIGVGLVKYFLSVDANSPSSIVFLLTTLFVIPLLAVIVNLWVTRFNLDSTNDNLKISISKISDDNRDFVQKVGILISDTVSRSSNYFTTVSSKHKEQLVNFIPDILEEFNFRFKELSNGHLYENDPSKYQEFVEKIFSMARKNIKATSYVDPAGFWQDANTINYLAENKRLIDSDFHIKIERYFYINDNNLQQSKIPIANNMSVGVDVFCILEREIKDKRFLKDCGVIDEHIAIESDVDGFRNIYKVDAYIGDKRKYKDNNNLFDLLQAIRKQPSEIYNEDDTTIKSSATIKF